MSILDDDEELFEEICPYIWLEAFIKAYCVNIVRFVDEKGNKRFINPRYILEDEHMDKNDTTCYYIMRNNKQPGKVKISLINLVPLSFSEKQNAITILAPYLGSFAYAANSHRIVLDQDAANDPSYKRFCDLLPSNYEVVLKPLYTTYRYEYLLADGLL